MSLSYWKIENFFLELLVFLLLLPVIAVGWVIGRLKEIEGHLRK
jgi:lipopolysaccharide biosynthesis regulator YciM